MKKILLIVMLLFLVSLSACGAKEDPVLIKIVFERGHGSMWGNQFYIEVTADQIQQVQYISKDTMELDNRNNIPITEQQWQALENAILLLELQEDNNTWKDKLFGQSTLDGGEYRRLTLTWKIGDKEKEVSYLWPQSQQAAEFESMLVQLVDSVK